MGKDVILSKALGVPEHPGRVRAAGFGVSQRFVFGSSQSTPQQQWTDWQLRAQQWMMQMSQWATQVSGGQPLFVPMPGQPPFVFMPGQPAVVPMPGQPASVSVPGQPASVPVPGQPPSTPIASQTTPLMPTPGQSHPHVDGLPQPQSNIPPQSQKGSCTPIASLEIPKGDHPCFLFLNSPRLHVAREIVYNKGGVTLHTMSLPPGHHKVSIDVFNHMRRTLHYLFHHLHQKERERNISKQRSLSPPMKGSIHRIIPEEFAGAEGILAFKNLRIMVQGDVVVHVVENTYSKYYWGKEFKDEFGTNEIIEVTRHRLLSGSSLCFYISYLCEAYLHDTDKASKFSFVSPFELKEKKTVNAHIVQALQRHANQDHLVLVPCNMGDHWVLIAINTSDETVYFMDLLCHHYTKRMDLYNMFHNVIITYRTTHGVMVNRTKMHQSTWVNIHCPKQMNVIDCGYYVGLFIGDILQHG
ncbi:Ulp1 protease family, C-terminal catalytic domain [Sesbania bispinosa]|nr:Ulp1 protease family, C-terminal catalytic domain [Sesbania bispinosa]